MHAAGPGAQSSADLLDMRQAERDVGMEAFAGLGQLHLAVAALEQLGTELILQIRAPRRRPPPGSCRARGRRAVKLCQPPGGFEDDEAAGRRATGGAGFP
jgi:hypothetical protein